MTIVEHLTKLEVSSAKAPRSGWESTVSGERREIEILFHQSPSLRREVPTLLGSAQVKKTVAEALRDIQRRNEMREFRDESATVARLLQADPPFTTNQVLDDWWPNSTGPSR